MKIIDCTGVAVAGTAARVTDAVVILPETAIVRKGMPFFRPDWAARWILRAKTGVVIDRLGKSVAERFVGRYWNHFVLAIQAEPSEREQATRVAGFDGSVMMSLPMSGETSDFALRASTMPRPGMPAETIVQDAFRANFDRETVARKVSLVSRFFTLHTGDIVLIEHVPEVAVEAMPDTRLVIEGGGETIVNHKIK